MILIKDESKQIDPGGGRFLLQFSYTVPYRLLMKSLVECCYYFSLSQTHTHTHQPHHHYHHLQQQHRLFSICRFREVTGRYPKKITMVSFTFKQTRFETLHAPALRWPPEQFQFIGVDPDASTGFDFAKASRGELENAAKPFRTDPYGCSSPVLQAKRESRNPFHRTHPYSLTCPELKTLLSYCGPELIPSEDVPWMQ